MTDDDEGDDMDLEQLVRFGTVFFSRPTNMVTIVLWQKKWYHSNGKMSQLVNLSEHDFFC